MTEGVKVNDALFGDVQAAERLLNGGGEKEGEGAKERKSDVVRDWKQESGEHWNDEIIYPIGKEDGWKVLNEDDDELGIDTKVYDNGKVVKRARLSDGRLFVCRELVGRDTIQAGQQAQVGKGVDKSGATQAVYATASMMSIAIKIDGREFVMEDFLDNFKLKDFNLMQMVFNSLNF